MNEIQRYSHETILPDANDPDPVIKSKLVPNEFGEVCKWEDVKAAIEAKQAEIDRLKQTSTEILAEKEDRETQLEAADERIVELVQWMV